MRSLAKQLVQNYRQCRDRFRHKPLEPQVDPLSWIGLIVVLALPLVLLWVFCMFRERPKLLAGDASPNFCIHLVDGTQRSFHEFLCQRHVPTLLVFYHTLQPLGKDEGHLLKVFQELEEIDQLVSYRDEDLQCIMVNVESMQKCQDIAASRPFGTVVHGHAVPPKAYSATGPVRKMLVDVEGKIVKIDTGDPGRVDPKHRLKIFSWVLERKPPKKSRSRAHRKRLERELGSLRTELAKCESIVEHLVEEIEEQTRRGALGASTAVAEAKAAMEGKQLRQKAAEPGVVDDLKGALNGFFSAIGTRVTLAVAPSEETVARAEREKGGVCGRHAGGRFWRI
ncbi:unnamed protein product [Durusdinium trenchii]|uniref:Thioredoxin domain-containing protein n=1 Tax=Durusdinium trenchii TaxID=1381693 RepID=A0ABP0SCX4_9DINO